MAWAITSTPLTIMPVRRRIRSATAPPVHLSFSGTTKITGGIDTCKTARAI